jgi:O-antigen ligase
MATSFIGLLLFLTFVYFEPSIFLPFLGNIRAALVVAILALITALLAGARPIRTLQNRLFIMLAVIAVISSIFSPLPFTAASQNHLSHLYKAIALFFLTTMVIASREYIVRFYYATIAFGLTVSTVTILTTRAGIPALKGGDLYRMTNFFGGIGDDSNEFGLLMLALFPLPFAMINSETSKLTKFIYGIIALSFLLCIIRTRSRGAFVGLIIVTGMLIFDNRKKVLTLLLMLMFLTYALFNTHTGYWERISTLQSQESITAEHNAYTRIMQNQFAFDLIADSPIIGVGLGNFIPAKIEILKEDPNSRHINYVSHNTYLGIGSELGLPALMIFIIIIVYSIINCIRAERLFYNRKEYSFYYYLCRALRSSLIGMSISMLFLSEQYNLIFYQWLALSVVLIHYAKTVVPDEKTAALELTDTSTEKSE